MFDTHIYENKTQYVDRNVTVKEYRAPTDESVKLLNEMTDKALNNIVQNFNTSNNCLQMTGAVYMDERLQQKSFLLKFTLNGKDHKLRVDVDGWECLTQQQMVGKVYTKVCEKLTEELMKPLLDELNRIGGNW